jgi:hypothetical protein
MFIPLLKNTKDNNPLKNVYTLNYGLWDFDTTFLSLPYYYFKTT